MTDKLQKICIAVQQKMFPNKPIHEVLQEIRREIINDKPLFDSEKPALSIGKYKGCPFSEVPWDYLEWYESTQHSRVSKEEMEAIREYMMRDGSSYRRRANY